MDSRKIGYFASGLLAMVLLGCVTTVANYKPSTVDVSEPPIGTISTAKVGDELLQQGTFADHDALLLSEEVSVGLIAGYRFTPGHYLKSGESAAGGFYQPSQAEGSGHVVSRPLTDPFSAILVSKDLKSICGVTQAGGKVCKDVASIKFIKLPVLSANSFQQTLLYNGRVGNRINVGYREYLGETSRPPFSNSVEYDLSDSKIIGYKGAELEIIEATNQQITYRVLKNFNAAKR